MIRFLLFLFIMMAMDNGMFIGYDIGKLTVRKDGKEHAFIHQDDIKRVLAIVLAVAFVAFMIQL